jgi:cytochrome c553
MALPAVRIDDRDRKALAHYFATLPVKPGKHSPGNDLELVAKGETMATTGDRSRNVPACLSCHGDRNRNQSYPVIDGQPREYLTTQLKLFRDRKRGGSGYENLMAAVTERLTDDDIDALAAFFSRSAPRD